MQQFKVLQGLSRVRKAQGRCSARIFSAVRKPRPK
ncbi:hypothetical protein EMEDMD4_790357 [Sinorhizobium medicae]|uniref:Uncharacterized protein n=1 Tax=Sinorhizobium medicae TaxID=110321 RepID=A0A508XAS5_9HYPH|nr:hypothetical protein EMEDMD4_1360002 [Sinorhizobium medicae]VTZ65333.1 hypothetical protein EMEDMD4_790357 [Sinorhizobium medicae]